MTPSFPHTEVRAKLLWSNFHGTIRDRRIPLFCIPNAGSMAHHGAALGAIVDHCLAEHKRLRVLGARWSLSSIIRPDELALDPANLNAVLRVAPQWLAPAYKPRALHGFVPVFAQSGAHISQLNRDLAKIGLALQTSGASDGHRIAGCIATGTHGSALHVGAVHDTVLALHIIVSSKRGLLVQSASSPAFSHDVAAWLTAQTGIPTEDIRDDELFAASLVSLGSLGLVHGVFLETTPLYRLSGRHLARPFADPEVWRAITSLDTRPLHPDRPERPYHFEVVMSPYPRHGHPGAFVRAFWKRPHPGAPTPVSPTGPEFSTDVMSLLAHLASAFDGPLVGAALELALNRELARRYKVGELKPRGPGEVFGPTALTPGHGTSTEIIVDHRDIHRALTAIYRTLSSAAQLGRHLLGALGLRFLPGTRSLLGGNIHAANCCIEMPSIRNAEVEALYGQCWHALEHEQVPFMCHWGQLGGMTPARLHTYFGARIGRWEAARRRILPTPAARRVFASPLANTLGLP